MKESPNDEPDLLNISDGNENMDQHRNSMYNKSNEKAQSSSKQERTSSPEQSFKVTCPQDSEVLSTICDNIYEDVGSNIIKDSLIRAKSDEDISDTTQNTGKVEKENQKGEKNSKDDEDDKGNFPKKNRPHKKSFIFKSVINIGRLNCPRPLEDQWNYEKILLDYNIIDFTSKKI